MSITAVPEFPSTKQQSAPSASLGLEAILVVSYAALLPYQVELAPDFRLAPADLCVLLAVFPLGVRLRYRTKAWSFWHLGILLTFCLGSFITASTYGELSRYLLINKDVGLLLLFGTYLVVTSSVSDWRQLRLVLQAFIGSVVLQNLVGIVLLPVAYFSGFVTFLTPYGGTRLAGLLVDPNAYGGLLVLTLLLCETTARDPWPLVGKKWLAFCRITLGLGILFTFSRTAWISLALALCCLLLTETGKAIRMMLAGAVAVGLLALFAADRFIVFLKEMATRPEAGPGRVELMEKALIHFAEHPFLGGGLGNYIATEGTIVHNTPLWFLSDFGLFGMVMFAGFMGWFFFKARHARRLALPNDRNVVLALLIGHVAMLVLGMGIEAFYQRHWWLVLALIASSCHLATRQQSVGEE